MKTKQTIRIFTASLVVAASMFLGTTTTVSAQETCGGVKTAIISCSQQGGDGASAKDTGLWGILVLAVNVLIAGVGVLALAGIVWGSILYTSAGGNPEQVKKAMGIFTNVVIGVVAFAGMWVFLNFLIPGGAFNSL